MRSAIHKSDATAPIASTGDHSVHCVGVHSGTAQDLARRTIRAPNARASNETELSHRWRERASLRISMLKLSCANLRAGQRLAGVVRLDVWCGLILAASVEIWTENHKDENAQGHPAEGDVDVMKQPISRPVQSDQVKIESERAASDATHTSEQKANPDPARTTSVLWRPRCEEQKNRTNANDCIRHGIVQIHGLSV